MKTIIVNPNNKLNSEFAGIEPPFWAGLTAANLTGKVEIVDAEVHNLNTSQTTYYVLSLHPDRVIISVMGNNPSASSTPKMPATIELCRKLKQEAPNLRIELTGIHPQSLPILSLAETGADAVVNYVQELRPIPWDLYNLTLYKTHWWHCLDGSDRSPYAVLYTSLGCPYRCYFCNVESLYGLSNRLRSIDDCISELNTLVYKYNVRNIKIWDELFTLKPERVMEFCDKVIQRGYNLNIWAYARLDTVNKGMLERMKKAGINWLGYGFEPKHIPDEKIEQAIKWTEDAGINIGANFMYGLSAYADDQFILPYALRHKFEYCNFYVALPYPGSKWYKESQPYMEWGDYSQFSDYVNGLDAGKLRNESFDTYYSDKGYLDKIKKKFGQCGVDTITTMLNQGKPGKG